MRGKRGTNLGKGASDSCRPHRVPASSMESSRAETAVRGMFTVWKWSGPVLLPCSVIVWGPPEKSVTLAKS